jgi:hypothetical protein
MRCRRFWLSQTLLLGLLVVVGACKKKASEGEGEEMTYFEVTDANAKSRTRAQKCKELGESLGEDRTFVNDRCLTMIENLARLCKPKIGHRWDEKKLQCLGPAGTPVILPDS